jgi:hypothetical protein
MPISGFCFLKAQCQSMVLNYKPGTMPINGIKFPSPGILCVEFGVQLAFELCVWLEFEFGVEHLIVQLDASREGHIPYHLNASFAGIHAKEAFLCTRYIPHRPNTL